MIGVFSSILGFIKKKDITITNNVFGLHYKVTVLILIAFSLLGTQKQYFGDSIDCIVKDPNADIIDTYCWIHSTYIHPELIDGEDTVSPGVGQGKKGMEKIYYTYYQWVPLFLFFQAALFYVPYNLWVGWEGGKMKKILLDLNDPLMGEKEQNKKTSLIVNYFIQNKSTHNTYAIKFFFCEVLNFVNVIGQIYFVDYFLGYEFTTYGSEIMNFSKMDLGTRIDPMERLFPKMTKCDFSAYGFSGTLQKSDALCVLPINIVNEKIFIFLWFWFIILAVISGLSLLYRGLVIANGPVRQHLIAQSASTVPTFILSDLVDLITVPEWFLIYQLGKNMDGLAYDGFIVQLHNKLKRTN